MNKKYKLSQGGFSLLEVMVAAGLLGVLSLGTMRVLETINKGQKTMSQKSEISSVLYNMTLALRDAEGCGRTLAGWGGHETPLDGGAGKTEIDNIHFGGMSGGLARVVKAGDGATTTKNSIFGEGTSGKMKVSLIEFVVEAGDVAGVGTPYPAKVRVHFEKFSAAAAAEPGSTSYKEIVVQIIKRDSDPLTGAPGHGHISGVNVDSGDVYECYTDTSSYVDASCTSLSGFSDSGKCKNIVIETTASATPPHPNAITAIGSLSVESIPLAGAVSGGDAFIDGDVEVGGDLEVDGDVDFGGSLTVKDNITSTEGDIEADDGNILATGSGPTGNVVATGYLQSKELRIRDGVLPMVARIKSDGAIEGKQLSVTGDIKSTANGDITTQNGNITTQNGNIETENGYIRTYSGNIAANTSANASGTMTNSGNLVAKNRAYVKEGEGTPLELATKKFVNDVIFSGLTDTEKEAIIADMIGDVESSTGRNALRDYILSRIRLNYLGSGGCDTDDNNKVVSAITATQTGSLFNINVYCENDDDTIDPVTYTFGQASGQCWHDYTSTCSVDGCLTSDIPQFNCSNGSLNRTVKVGRDADWDGGDANYDGDYIQWWCCRPKQN